MEFLCGMSTQPNGNLTQTKCNLCFIFIFVIKLGILLLDLVLQLSNHFKMLLLIRSVLS